MEEAKVNMYHLVSSFATLHEVWWVLSDGETVIITKPENAFEVDKEKHMYSLLYTKDKIVHSFRVKTTGMIIMTDFGISLYEVDHDRTNKKDDTKI